MDGSAAGGLFLMLVLVAFMLTGVAGGWAYSKKQDLSWSALAGIGAMLALLVVFGGIYLAGRVFG